VRGGRAADRCRLQEIDVSLAQRFERRLEGLVGGAFARVFKGQVEPVEIGTALQREAADRKNIMGNGQVMCPNRYRVTLSSSDYERLAPWEAQLTESLAELVQEYLDENRWSTVGDVEVYLAQDDQLHTGVFGVASRMEPQAPPRRRPHDSLSLPIVSGPGIDGPGLGHPALSVPAPPAGPSAPNYPPQVPPSPHVPEFPAPPFPAPPFPAPQLPASQLPAQPAPPVQPRPPVPRSAGQALLVVDQTNQRFDLRMGSNVIGRGGDSDLQLLDQGVSRRHVDIQYDGVRATIYDLGSTNGTTVNGHEVGSHVLQHGDVVRVGHTRLVFQQEQA
jgi:hypothetical protein